MILADPALADRALSTLVRWDTHVSARSKPLRDTWVQIIQERNWAAALKETERGNQLRQASPLATLLPNSVRLAIISQVRDLEHDSVRGGLLAFGQTGIDVRYHRTAKVEQQQPASTGYFWDAYGWLLLIDRAHS